MSWPVPFCSEQKLKSLAGEVTIDIPPGFGEVRLLGGLPATGADALSPDLTKRTSSHVSFAHGHDFESLLWPEPSADGPSVHVVPAHANRAPFVEGEGGGKRPMRSKLADWILGATISCALERYPSIYILQFFSKHVLAELFPLLLPYI